MATFTASVLDKDGTRFEFKIDRNEKYIKVFQGNKQVDTISINKYITDGSEVLKKGLEYLNRK